MTTICADAQTSMIRRCCDILCFVASKNKRGLVNFSLSVLLKMNLTNPKNEFFLACGTSS